MEGKMNDNKMKNKNIYIKTKTPKKSLNSQHSRECIPYACTILCNRLKLKKKNEREAQAATTKQKKICT